MNPVSFPRHEDRIDEQTGVLPSFNRQQNARAVRHRAPIFLIERLWKMWHTGCFIPQSFAAAECRSLIWNGLPLQGSQEMKRFFFACLAAAGVLSASSAFADHKSGYDSYNQFGHSSHDPALARRPNHHYPMTSGQHHAPRLHFSQPVFESHHNATSGIHRKHGWQSRQTPDFGRNRYRW